MEFYPAAQQIQQPDIYGSYLRGQMAPYQVQGAQQQVEQGGLQLAQLRLALQNQQTYRDVALNALEQQGALGAPTGGQNAATSTGGIQNGPQSAVSSQPYNGSVSGMSPSTLMALEYLKPGGGDPLKTAQGVQEYQIKQRQLQVQGPMALADTVSTSPNADVLIRNNPGLQQQWLEIAPKLGLDPFRDLTPANARKAAIFGYNQLAGSAGLPPKAMPTELANVNLGQGEVAQINKLTGKKEGDLIERQTPTFTLKDIYDPNTQRTRAVAIQTGGYGMAGTNPSAPGGASAGQGVDLGVKEPSQENLKNAEMAVYMRSGLRGVQQLESQGYELSPRARALIIDAATNEGEGLTRQYLSQVAVKNGLSQKDQTYMASLMPMLQAAGHSMAGAKLTLGQVRQNFESLIPVDITNKAAMAKVNESRNNYYTGLLSQSGPAVELPQYQNTLKADLTTAQQQATGVSKTIGGKTYVKRNGKWYAD